MRDKITTRKSLIKSRKKRNIFFCSSRISSHWILFALFSVDSFFFFLSLFFAYFEIDRSVKCVWYIRHKPIRQSYDENRVLYAHTTVTNTVERMRAHHDTVIVAAIVVVDCVFVLLSQTLVAGASAFFPFGRCYRWRIVKTSDGNINSSNGCKKKSDRSRNEQREHDEQKKRQNEKSAT